MGKFTVIPQDAFDALQMDAGVLLKTFDPTDPDAPDDEDIICATTGGINPTCIPNSISIPLAHMKPFGQMISMNGL